MGASANGEREIALVSNEWRTGKGSHAVVTHGSHWRRSLFALGRRGLAPGVTLRHLSARMTAAPAIAVDQLVKVYKNVTAVDGISFALEPGSITGLLGGNGAGKTTTIATIMGLVIPTSGRVTVLGTDMARHRHRILHRMNFESPYVEMPMRLTIRQNLTVFAMLYGVDDVAARIAVL